MLREGPLPGAFLADNTCRAGPRLQAHNRSRRRPASDAVNHSRGQPFARSETTRPNKDDGALGTSSFVEGRRAVTEVQRPEARRAGVRALSRRSTVERSCAHAPCGNQASFEPSTGSAAGTSAPQGSGGRTAGGRARISQWGRHQLHFDGALLGALLPRRPHRVLHGSSLVRLSDCGVGARWRARDLVSGGKLQLARQQLPMPARFHTQMPACFHMQMPARFQLQMPACFHMQVTARFHVQQKGWVSQRLQPQGCAKGEGGRGEKRTRGKTQIRSRKTSAWCCLSLPEPWG